MSGLLLDDVQCITKEQDILEELVRFYEDLFSKDVDLAL